MRRHGMRGLWLFLGCVLWSVTGLSVAAGATPFAQGPVGSLHPACVALLAGLPTEKPYIFSISLETCQANVQARLPVFTMGKRQCFYVQAASSANMKPYLCSEWVGTTTQGIRVLHVFYGGVQPGEYDRVLLVKVRTIDEYRLPLDSVVQMDKGPFLIRLGYLRGGYQCAGGIAKIVVQGDVLHVTQYPVSNAPAQCQGAVTYSADLGLLNGFFAKIL